MLIKVFDDIFEAEDYIYSHPYEIVYLSSLNRFLYCFIFENHLCDDYRECSSVPFTSEFYSEVIALLKDLILYILEDFEIA